MSGYLRSYWSLVRRHPGQVLAVMREDLLRLGRGWFAR